MIQRLLLALALIGGTAAASSPSAHTAWTAAAFSRVPVSVADRAPERADLKAQHTARFVAAIARVSQSAPLPARQWTSLLLALGASESNFDTDVVEGRCPAHRCDVVIRKGERVFLAKGAFQNHHVGPVRDLWPIADGNPEAQVEMADRMLRRSLVRCAPFAPFPAHVFRAYRGGSCSWALKDEAIRAATFSRLVSK